MKAFKAFNYILLLIAQITLYIAYGVPLLVAVFAIAVPAILYYIEGINEQTNSKYDRR